MAAGAIDEAVVTALREIAHRVTATRAAPAGAPAWSDGDIDDVIFATIARVTPDGMVTAASNAVNDREFSGWLRKAMVTTLDLEARDTPTGWVMRTIADALAEDPSFVSDGDRWRLEDQEPEETWDHDVVPLNMVAWSVQTKTIRHSPNAQKHQIAWRDDMRAVCRAVLEVSGPLDKVELAQIVAGRFNTLYGGRLGYLDLDDEERAIEVAGDGVEISSTEVIDTASWLMTQLTEDERDAVALVASSSGLRELGQHLGCGTEKATKIKARVAQKLQHVYGAAGITEDDAHEVTAVLLKMIERDAELRHSMDDHGRDDEH